MTFPTIPTVAAERVLIDISGDAVGGIERAVRFRQLNTTSEDVGVFSCDLSDARNVAVVIAVRPQPSPIAKSL